MGSVYVSELLPPKGLFFIPHTTYEYGEQWCNDIDRENPKNSEKNLYHCHFVHYKPDMD
jgi:hypothetical protein